LLGNLLMGLLHLVRRSALKQLSASSPAMTAAAAGPAAAAAVASAAAGAAAASSAAVAISATDTVGGQVLMEESLVLASASPGSISSVGSVVAALAPVNTMAALPLPLPSPGSSKARQKKFHRHFKSVDADERVINCKYRNRRGTSRESLGRKA